MSQEHAAILIARFLTIPLCMSSALPIVEVMPVVQTHLTGSDIELKCHAEGVPKPVITWKLAGKVLENSAHTTHYCM